MSKTYQVIVKVGKNKFVKYRVNNLIAFTKFIDKQYKDWRWFNVYDKKTKAQIASYTKYNKPLLKNTPSIKKY